MEYPSRNDFFLKFKAIYNEKNRFVDYILVDSSKNLDDIINCESITLMGKKVFEIVLENKNNILGLKELSYHMIPNTRRKFEIYNEELGIWHLVNIFSDGKDYLLIFYTDITRFKDDDKNPLIKSFKDYEEFERSCM